MESGTIRLIGGAQTIKFKTPYCDKPTITLTCNDSDAIIYVTNVTLFGFTLYCNNSNADALWQSYGHKINN